MRKKKLAIITLGCSKNLVDSEDIATRLSDKYDIVFEDASDAYAVALNTCGFILDAKQESINAILEYAQLKSQGRIKKLFVFGCLSQRYKKDLEGEIPEVDGFFGVDCLEDILDALDCHEQNECAEARPRMISTPPHTAYLKIAEGCSRMCAFCAIPYIRGRYKSRPIDDIVEEARMLAEHGVREINVIAQDLSCYGRDIYGDFRLPDLVERLAAIPELHWIRLHYTYPNNFPLRTLDIMRQSPKVCKYLDIPIQHINDNVLLKMKRGHTKAETLALIKRLREEVPDVALRTSLLVGFPGETEKAFNELVEFVREARFDRLGVFPYSAEEGTFSAEHYKDRISKKQKLERADYIMSIQQRISLELNLSKIGKVYEVLVDREEGEYFVGRTQYDSPDVDCEVLISKNEASGMEVGKFYMAKVVDAEEFDLYAVPFVENE